MLYKQNSFPDMFSYVGKLMIYIILINTYSHKTYFRTCKYIYIGIYVCIYKVYIHIQWN